MQSHRLQITDIAFGGRGVGRLDDGRAAFVPFVIEGESVRVEIVRERRNYVEARLVAVEEPSPQRVAAPCPYFGRCGGCSYQHIAAGEQLRLKAKQVEQAIRRIGRSDAVRMEAMIASPRNYGYRNRITVHVDAGKVGFFAQGGREIVDIAECPIAEPELNEALTHFRDQPHAQTGHRTLRSPTTGRTFQQTNDGAAAELLRVVTDLAGDGNGKRLIDAYCGAGFFLKHLRADFAEVVGLEWDRWAVAEAEREVGANERYLCGDVAVHLNKELRAGAADKTLLICDPPAEGLSGEVRQMLNAHPPSVIIYVSCNPATLSRDIAALAGTYQLVSVQPIDMFPQTAQIEAVAYLRAL